MRKILRPIAGFFLLLATLPIVAQTAGMVTVSGTHITDSKGQPLASGVISFSPVSNTGSPISFKISGKGQSMSTPVTAIVVNGAFTITLPDTNLTKPQNVCFAVKLTANSKTGLSTGYNCVQPAATSDWCTASVCNFDNFTPNLAGQAIIQTGPQGPAGPPVDPSTALVVASVAARSTNGAFNCSLSSWAGADAGARINSCISTAVAAGASELVIPAGTYTVNTTILPLSNLWVHGQGKTSTILIGGPSIGANPIFNMLGTTSAHLSNIRISDLEVQNGTGTTNPATTNNSGIVGSYVDGFTIDNVEANGIGGLYGIFCTVCTKGRITNNAVLNFGYAGIMIGGESDTITIDNNDVENSTVSGIGKNSYGIVAAALTGSGQTRYAINVTVSNNTVRNIPSWEGLDAHGGQHLKFINNKVENVATGILTAMAQSTSVTNPIIDDVIVQGNSLTQGTGSPNGHCTYAAGNDVISGFAYNPITGYVLKDNNCTGFGATSTASGNTGVFSFGESVGAQIEGNTCNQWFNYCIEPRNLNINGRIIGNFAYNVGGASFSSSWMIGDANLGGNWGIEVDGNNLIPDSTATAPSGFLLAAYQNTAYKIGRNHASHYATAFYGGSFIPSGFTAAPASASKLNARFGDVIYDAAGKAVYAFGGSSMPVSGFSSLDTTDPISGVNCDGSTATVTAPSGGLGGTHWYLWLPKGANVSIAGCGPSGGVLNTSIIGTDGLTQITLANATSTAQTAAPVTYQGAQVNAAISSNFQLLVNSNPCLGVELMGDLAIFTNSGSIGFAFSNCGPFTAYNAYQPTKGVDSWALINPALSANIVLQTGSGLLYYTAAAGKASAPFATFWTATPIPGAAAIRAGIITMTSSGTTWPVTFSPAMTIAPSNCSITAYSNLGTTTFWTTGISASGFTANFSTAGTYTFGYTCVRTNAN